MTGIFFEVSKVAHKSSLVQQRRPVHICKHCVPGSLYLCQHKSLWSMANLYCDLYYTACRHRQENLSHLVVEMQMLSMSSSNHATPTQACRPRMESVKNFSSYVYMYQSRP